MCAVQLDEADGVETIRSSVSLCKLTDVTDELVDVRFLQQTQLTHAGERVESFIDDELLGVAQALLEERLQDGGALPADVRRYAFNTTTGEWKHTAGEKIHTFITSQFISLSAMNHSVYPQRNFNTQLLSKTT